MSKFKELVQSLDRDGLNELRKHVAAELGERRQSEAIQMEQIRPGMSVDEKRAAFQEIARILRGEE